MWRCCAVSMLLFYHCCGVARLLLYDCLLQDQTKLEFAQDSSKSCKMELSKFLHGLFDIVPWICQVIIYMFLNLYWTKPSWSLTYILKLVDWLKELNKVECLGSSEGLSHALEGLVMMVAAHQTSIPVMSNFPASGFTCYLPPLLSCRLDHLRPSTLEERKDFDGTSMDLIKTSLFNNLY